MIKKRRLSQSRDPNFEYEYADKSPYEDYPITEEEEEAWKALEKTDALLPKCDDS
jgi:hypothetical protein